MKFFKRKREKASEKMKRKMRMKVLRLEYWRVRQITLSLRHWRGWAERSHEPMPLAYFNHDVCLEGGEEK